MNNAEFPKGFIWGTATASYQIEGAAYEDGKGLNIWDTFSHQKGEIHKNDNGDVACDHYHRFEEDIDLMAELGTSSYRFSISWARIIPTGEKDSEINPKGIEFYNKLIDKLLSKNIQPMVTLYHWDLPQNLQDKFQGFLSRELVEHFLFYAKTCFQAFGDRVKNWITFNEPWVICVLGHAIGMHAPGRRAKGGIEPYIAAHHLLLAHAHTYKLYSETFKPEQKGVCGITLNSEWFEPVLKGKNQQHDSENERLALRAMDWTLGWFAEPVYLTGDYPEIMKESVFSKRKGLMERVEFSEEEKQLLKGSSDFFGLNHYSTQFVYKPRGFLENIKMGLTGGVHALRMLASEGASYSKSFSIAKAVVTKANYMKDIGAPQHPGFYANDTYLDWEKKDYGVTHMGWKVVPFGFRNLLKFIQQKYHPAGGIIVTENGLANKENNVADAMKPEIGNKRIEFYRMYLTEMKMAIEQGADVRGYFAWSFLDNYEWAFGYEKRFGLVFVDYKTQERTKKPVFHWYKDVASSNSLPIAEKADSPEPAKE